MKLNPLALFLFSFLTHNPWAANIPTLPKEYDYVVIGGGIAGLTVASRLSENPAVSVAVLEVGSNVEDLPEVYVPGLIGFGQAFTTLNWAYKTVPQDHLGGRNITINAGKALGGGSIINSMIFPRAEKGQYDAWGELNNNDPNWTWDSLFHYFKKSEILTPPNESQLAAGVKYIREVHGTSEVEGRVHVGFPNYFYPQSKMWHTASGFALSPDLSAGHPQGEVGISINSLDAKNNTRCSSVCAYYTPFADRPNLTVLTEVLVSRILWEQSPQKPGSANAIVNGSKARVKAIGVEFTHTSPHGERSRVYVGREVIVAAGAIGSPKVLELSGVGNSTILKAAGVEPVLDLPSVGENLADHVHSWANSFTNASVTKDLLRSDPNFYAEQSALWYHNRTGVLSACPRSLGLAAASDLFSESQLTSLLQDAKSNIEHYATLFSNGNADLAKGIQTQHEIALRIWEEDKIAPVEMNFEPGYSGPTALANRPPHQKYTAINAVLFAPLSRGRTHIKSSDPSQLAAIDPAYYAHPLDLATHVKSIQLGRDMLRTPPLDGIYQGENEPGPDVKTEEDLTKWAVKVSSSDNHVIGSLAMMPRELGGVVDTRLRLYGAQNVRVVDASIIPMPVSAHLSSTVYAVAERAADFIKEDSIKHFSIP